MSKMRRAFTLTEMLVVLGIILLLISILIPVLIRAQRAAKVTQCSSHLRQIGTALSSYITANQDYLPPGGTANSAFSPGSPVGKTGAIPPVYVEINGNSSQWPEEMAPPARYYGPPGYFDYDILPLAYFLKGFLAPTKANWACPAAPRNAFAISGTVAPDEDEAHFGPFGGHTSRDRFKPCYRYMGTADLWLVLHEPDDSHNRPILWPVERMTPAKSMMAAMLLSRNIGGLKVQQLKPLTGGLADIVTCLDIEITAHTFESDGFPNTMYDWAPAISDWEPQTPKVVGNWCANVLYLDGRVEKRLFKNKAEYVRTLHDQIPQRWGYVQLLDRARMEWPWQQTGRDVMR